MARALTVILVFMSLCVQAHAQTVVSLKSVARINPDAPLLLSDIASVQGDDAESVSKLVVRSDPASAFAGRAWIAIDVPEVRRLLSEQHPSGTHIVSGRHCSVGVRTTATAKPAGVQKTLMPGETTGSTVRDHVLARLRSLLDVDSEQLRVTFSEGEKELLATSTVGKRVTVQPLGVSSRVPLRITMYDPAGRIVDGTVRPEVVVERQGPVVLRDVRRGETLLADAITIESRWVAADLEPADSDKAIGAEATKAIRKGQMVSLRDVRAPLLVREGGLVRVHCVVGGIVLEMEARALSDGRLGEIIEFEPKSTDKSRRNRVFEAKVVGRGRASVIDTDAPVSLAQSTGQSP